MGMKKLIHNGKLSVANEINPNIIHNTIEDDLEMALALPERARKRAVTKILEEVDLMNDEQFVTIIEALTGQISIID